ncbi:MrcB family domain-containing protein [Nocardia sp. NPDC047654]|uniref:MrcB family domain-containing protein n=1 Tax=Nocardia sp. NPDC047654 TaxID=3364314 RepID=UPI003721FA2E
MPLGDLLNEVLTLQADRTNDPNAPAMRRRRTLVEVEIRDLIRDVLSEPFPAWQADGSNGKGAPAETPWTRFCDLERSPKPGQGWYAVYLFDASGDKLYLSLNQGTTIWDTERRTFVFRPKEQLSGRVQWARSVLATDGAAPKTFTDIHLSGRSQLGRAYNFGNVHGIEYQAGALPSEDELRQDLLHIGRLLEKLYTVDAQTVYLPGDEPPEVADVELAADQAAGNVRRKKNAGQGFRLDTPAKLAIEKHAVKLATEHFKELGYKVEYTGDKQSYDLLATLEGFEDDPLYVEVKGTASLGEQILLTRAEVEHHLAHPNNALFLVHSILLDRTNGATIAYGGTPIVKQPWKIDEAGLTVISYKYRIPPA